MVCVFSVGGKRTRPTLFLLILAHQVLAIDIGFLVGSDAVSKATLNHKLYNFDTGCQK